jgi:hypothetical protein
MMPCFFLITACHSITDELRETECVDSQVYRLSEQSPPKTNKKSTQPDQDLCDTRGRPCLCETSIDYCETGLVHCDGFSRALPTDGGLSGPSYQLL